MVQKTPKQLFTLGNLYFFKKKKKKGLFLFNKKVKFLKCLILLEHNQLNKNFSWIKIDK